MSGSEPECEQVEAALSARLDGEDPGLDDDVVAVHLAGCAGCRAFEQRLGRPVLDTSAPPTGLAPVRPLRAVSAADTADPPAGPDPSPDLAARVTAVAAAEDRAGVWWVLRGLLAVVAVGYLATAVPELLFASDPHHAHLARHLGAFEAAYGVGLLFVAVRPAKARAMVPFTLTLAAVMFVVMVVDLVNGQAFLLNELSHVLEVAGLVLVWLLATRRGWPGRRDERSRTSRGPGAAGSEPGGPRPTLVVAEPGDEPRLSRPRAG